MIQEKFTQLLTRFKNISSQALKLYCVSIATIIGIRVIQAQKGWITDDSVLYLEMARLFTQGEWEAGLALYNWPFYPAIIAGLHQLTGLDLQTSAQCLAILFFGLTIYGFATLITLCGGGRLAVACGTLILLSSTYIVGDILPMLIRDHGFWAFFILGLVYFIRFYQTGELQMAMLWQITIITATLFRIEAVTFLVLLPLSLLNKHPDNTLMKLSRLLHAYLLVIGIAVLLFLMSQTETINQAGIGRLTELISTETYARLGETFSTRSELMASQVLGGFLEEYATVSLLLSLLLIIVVKTVGTSGLITIALVVNAFREKFRGLSSTARAVLPWASGIALLNMFFILMKEFILSGRYVISLSLILMTVASISLSNLFSSWPETSKSDQTRKNIAIGLLILLVLGMSANLLPVKAGHNYEQEAVSWIKQQTSPSDKVFYVSPRARYFAGEPYKGRGVDYWSQVTKAISDHSIHDYDYLAINISHHHDPQAELMQQLSDYRLVKVFEGVKGKKKMLIFAKIKDSNSAY